MKVVQINTVYGGGSTGGIVRRLHHEMLGRGIESRVAAGRAVGRADPDEMVRVGGPYSRVTHALRSRLLDDHGMASRPATERLVMWLEDEAPDVVHLHNLHGYYLHFPLLFEHLRSTGVPVVWTLHDSWSYTGHCAYYDFVGCHKWEVECHSCPQTAGYPKSWGVDRSRRNFRVKRAELDLAGRGVLVSPSRWLAGELSRSLLSDWPVRVIPNDPDLTTFIPQERESTRDAYEWSDRFVILGVASQWTPRKGAHFLGELASSLHSDEVLVVVGEQDALRAGTPNVCLIDRTHDAAELAALYSAADVFVNPTLEDNYPTTNLESLACGTPVVTFATGGSPEALERGRGVVTGERTAVGLRSSIDEVRHSPRVGRPETASILETRLSQVGRGMLASYLELYESVAR